MSEGGSPFPPPKAESAALCRGAAASPGQGLGTARAGLGTAPGKDWRSAGWQRREGIRRAGSSLSWGKK